MVTHKNFPGSVPTQTYRAVTCACLEINCGFRKNVAVCVDSSLQPGHCCCCWTNVTKVSVFLENQGNEARSTAVAAPRVAIYTIYTIYTIFTHTTAPHTLHVTPTITPLDTS